MWPEIVSTNRLPGDTRTPSERRAWRDAASMVEWRVNESMAELAVWARRSRRCQRIATVVEARFHVPTAALEA